MVHWPVFRNNNSSCPKMLHCLIQVHIVVKYELNLGEKNGVIISVGMMTLGSVIIA